MIGKEGYRYGREKSNKKRKKIEKHLENEKMVVESEQNMKGYDNKGRIVNF